MLHPTDLLIFTLAADVSIASLNVSLLVNNVGFYQVPCTCQYDFTFHNSPPPRSPSSSSSRLCALSNTSGLAAGFHPLWSLPSLWWPLASALCTYW